MVMQDMNARLATDPELAEHYRRGHEDYLARRARSATCPRSPTSPRAGCPTA